MQYNFIRIASEVTEFQYWSYNTNAIIMMMITSKILLINVFFVKA